MGTKKHQPGCRCCCGSVFHNWIPNLACEETLSLVSREVELTINSVSWSSIPAGCSLASLNALVVGTHLLAYCGSGKGTPFSACNVCYNLLLSGCVSIELVSCISTNVRGTPPPPHVDNTFASAYSANAGTTCPWPATSMPGASDPGDLTYARERIGEESHDLPNGPLCTQEVLSFPGEQWRIVNRATGAVLGTVPPGATSWRLLL